MANAQGDPWGLRAADFPEGGALADKLAFCLGYAVLAPSGHNTQPWFFALREEAVDVYADTLRALPVVDPQHRELIISCGAALETLVVAMGRFGLRHDVQLTPDPGKPDHLARVRVLGLGAPDESDPLFSAITRRHTSRVAYGEEPVSRDVVLALETEPLAEGVWFHKVPGLDERLAVADLVEEGDRIQMADGHFRQELSEWLHRNTSASRDGMPGYAFGVGDLASTLGPLLIRTFDLGERQAAKDRSLALKSPLLGVVGTDRDGVRPWIGAGRALARVLLRATAAGLSASFLNQPIEVPELRPRLATAIGYPGLPQLLLRFGIAPPVRPTPRRPLDAVVVR